MFWQPLENTRRSRQEAWPAGLAFKNVKGGQVARVVINVTSDLINEPDPANGGGWHSSLVVTTKTSIRAFLRQ